MAMGTTRFGAMWGCGLIFGWGGLFFFWGGSCLGVCFFGAALFRVGGIWVFFWGGHFGLGGFSGVMGFFGEGGRSGGFRGSFFGGGGLGLWGGGRL